MDYYYTTMSEFYNYNKVTNSTIIIKTHRSTTECNGKDKWIYTLIIYRIYDESDS